MDQKCNIATRELDELREEIQRDQEEAEINYDNLRVSGWRHTDTYTHTFEYSTVQWIVLQWFCRQ